MQLLTVGISKSWISWMRRRTSNNKNIYHILLYCIHTTYYIIWHHFTGQLQIRHDKQLNTNVIWKRNYTKDYETKASPISFFCSARFLRSESHCKSHKPTCLHLIQITLNNKRQNWIVYITLYHKTPVWSGFLTADLINWIQALLKRLFKFSYSSHLISFSDLIKSCSEDFFENAHKSNHCLHELFSSYVHRLESLCPRGHDLMLRACTGYLHKQ